MKAFFVSALTLLVSAVAASVVPRQTDSEPFVITAVASYTPGVVDKNAFASFDDGRVYLGPAPINEADEPIVAKYESQDLTIENAFDSYQKLWVKDQGGAVYLQSGAPSSDSYDRSYLIPSDGEVTFVGARFPNGWTACPTDTPGTYELFYRNFGEGCAAVKLAKSKPKPTINP